MKLLVSLAAAAFVATVAAPAVAQDQMDHETVTSSEVAHSDVTKTVRHGGGHHWRTKRVCKVRWVHHRRVKKCWMQRVHW